MFRSATLLLFAGCPYVFEQPDLSNVHGDPVTDASQQVEGDADTDVDSDGDTDDPGPGGAPTLVSVEITPRLDGISVAFSIADPEDDLVGGSLSVTDGTDTFDVAIPGDLERWNPDGVSKATIHLGNWIDCDTPTFDRTWSITPTDFAGHTGGTVDGSVHINQVGSLGEVGNFWPQDAHRISDAPPFMGCVTYEVDDGDSTPIREQLFRDVEAMFFVTPQSRDYRLALTWVPDADIDIFVYTDPLVDANSDGLPDITVSSATYSMPEQAILEAKEGDSWLFDPTFFNLVAGGEPPFVGFFLVAPD